MKLYGVIGNPVTHSLSPQIHSHFAAQTGVELEYRKLSCAAEDFANTLKAFCHEGGLGLNVTVPFKRQAWDMATERSADAELAGSANTLEFAGPDQIRAHNTDGSGLLRDLERLKLGIRGRKIALIGAGGAALGILKPLLDQDPAELVWSNRNPWKIEELTPRFAAFGNLRPCTNLALKGDRFDLIINATSAGHDGVAPMLPDGLLAAGASAYDVSYGAGARPFLDWAKRQGAERGEDGLGMLIEQAAASFEIWHGLRPDTAALHAEPGVWAAGTDEPRQSNFGTNFSIVRGE